MLALIVEGKIAGVPTLAEHPILGRALLDLDEFKSAWFKVPQIRAAVFRMGALVICFPLLLWRAAGGETSPWALLLSLPIGATALGFGLLRGRTNWARSAVDGANGRPVEYVFDDSGYEVNASSRQSRAEWATLQGHLETESVFILYATAQAIILIPKRAFSMGDQARLRAEFQARIRKTKVTRGGRLRWLVFLWVLLLLAFFLIHHFLGEG